MKNTTNKKTVKATTVKSVTSKNEVKVITEENFNNSVVKGGKYKDVKNELTNYLRSQFNALYITNNVSTFQLKVSDVIKQFLVITDNKINASSYDLYAIIQEVCFTLATEYKKTENRIPCIKANSNNVPILMTCDKSKYNFFYEKNIKSLATIEKSKKAREEKAKKEEEEKAREEEEKKNSIVDNSEKATICIMELLAKYGNSLDLVAIKQGIATIEKATNKKSEKKNKNVA